MSFLQVLFCLFVWVMLFELNLKHYERLFKNSINNFGNIEISWYNNSGRVFSSNSGRIFVQSVKKNR